LIARRSLNDPEENAYYLSNAPADMPLLKMAQIAAQRCTVERCIEEAKGETGLDDYQVRHWQSCQRHITLSTMAHTWLAVVRYKANQEKGGGPEPFLAELTVPQVRRFLEAALPLPDRSRELRLAWSRWRRAKRL
jgi:SRSO17 transposase